MDSLIKKNHGEFWCSICCHPPKLLKRESFCHLRSHHDDVIKWKQFPRYWPFVRRIHRSPVKSPHKGQWREALMLSLICAWINVRVNNREAADLTLRRAHYDVTLIMVLICSHCNQPCILSACRQKYLILPHSRWVHGRNMPQSMCEKYHFCQPTGLHDLNIDETMACIPISLKGNWWWVAMDFVPLRLVETVMQKTFKNIMHITETSTRMMAQTGLVNLMLFVCWDLFLFVSWIKILFKRLFFTLGYIGSH